MPSDEDLATYPALMTPAAELAEARTFLSGWTLSRYVERFRAESERSHARSFSEDEGGDGVTPCCTLTPGGGAFGWSRVGPPSTSPGASLARRRPRGVLTLPSDATVGQALRTLAAADLLAAPAVDRASLEHRGFVSCGDLLRQLLRACYPRLLAPDLLSQEDMEAFFRHEARGDDERPNVDAEDDDDEFAARARDAEREFQSAWRAFARVGDDGDVCFAGFDDTTVLDFVSRGLDCRKLEEKRRGDFEPGHRVAIFAERSSADVPEPEENQNDASETRDARDRRNGGGDSEHLSSVFSELESPVSAFRAKKNHSQPPPGLEPGTARGDARGEAEAVVRREKKTQTRGVEYLAVLSQLDVIDAMVRDADALGAFVRLKTMSDLGFCSYENDSFSSDVVCVTETLPAAAAFAVAINCNVSALPVLDASKRFLIGSVSVSDARVFERPEDLRWLNEQIGSFLRRKVWPSRPRDTGTDASEERAFPSATTVTPNASLLEAMTKMSKHRVHRVYVCDSPRAPPRGVCTATDVMRVFALDPETAEGRARLTW
jgi:CBS domain-containing protein